MGGQLSRKLGTLLLIPFEIHSAPTVGPQPSAINSSTGGNDGETRFFEIKASESQPFEFSDNASKVLVHFDRVKVGFWYRDKDLTARLVMRKKHETEWEIDIPIFERVRASEQVKMQQQQGLEHRPQDRVVKIPGDLSDYEARLQAFIHDNGAVVRSFNVDWHDLESNDEEPRLTLSAPPFIKYAEIKFKKLPPVSVEIKDKELSVVESSTE